MRGQQTARWLVAFVLIITAPGCFGQAETIEVSSSGGLTCDCEARCMEETNAIRLSLEEIKKNLAIELDSVKASKAESDKSNSQLRENIQVLQESLDRASAMKTESDRKVAQLEAEVADTNAKLDAKTRLVSTAQAEKDEVARQGSERAQGLRLKLLDAVEKQRSVESSARECNEALVEVAKREADFKKNTEVAVARLRAEVRELQKRNDKATELERLHQTTVRTLQETEAAAAEFERLHLTALKTLEETEKAFSKQVKEEKAKHSELSEKYFSTRRDLFEAGERLREFHRNATTTYINGTLIRQDVAVGIIWLSNGLAGKWNETLVFISPRLDALVVALAPLKEHSFQLYHQVLYPSVSIVVTNTKSVYSERIHPQLEKYAFPFLAPLWNPVLDVFETVHSLASAGFARVLTSLRHYLELVDTDHPALRDWIVSSLDYAIGNSARMITYLFLFICGTFCVLITRFARVTPPKKHKNPRKIEKIV